MAPTSNSQGNVNIAIVVNAKNAKSEADVVADRLAKIKRAAYSANLSLLFAGAAMQRLAMSAINFGTKAYDDIAHSIVGTVTAADRLNGSMTMLGFSVGEAIQPLLEMLIPIVEAISDWVSENPELTRTILGLVAAIGTLLVLNSSINLFTSSISGLGKNISLLPTFVGITFAIMGIQEITEGNIMKGMGEIFTGMGLGLSSIKGAGGLAAGLMITGLVLQISDAATKGGAGFSTCLVGALQGAYAGFLLGGWWGAVIGLVAVLAIETIVFNWPVIKKQLDDFIQTLKDYLPSMIGIKAGDWSKGQEDSWNAGASQAPEGSVKVIPKTSYMDRTGLPSGSFDNSVNGFMQPIRIELTVKQDSSSSTYQAIMDRTNSSQIIKVGG